MHSTQNSGLFGEEFEEAVLKLGRGLARVASVDARTLAFSRVMLGLCVLYDIITRAVFLAEMYTDSGFASREDMIRSGFYNPLWISLHFSSGSLPWQVFLTAIHILLAFCVILGYRIKYTLPLTWLFVTSIQCRNFLLNFGGDIFLRLLLFWCCFFPMGRCFSLDAMRKCHKNAIRGVALLGSASAPVILPSGSSAVQPKRKANAIVSFAVIAYLLQEFYAYSVSTLHKTGDSWNKDYTATEMALRLTYFRTSFAAVFQQYPAFCKWLTWVTLGWEWYAPFLLFSPVFLDFCRILCVLGFVGMHIGFSLCLKLNLFSPVMCTGISIALPAYFWDELVFKRLLHKTRLRASTLQLLYNPQSAWVPALVSFLRVFVVHPSMSIVPAAFAKTDPQGIAIIDLASARRYDSLWRVLYLCFWSSPLFWPLAYIMRLPKIRSWFNSGPQGDSRANAAIAGVFEKVTRPVLKAPRTPFWKRVRFSWRASSWVFKQLLLVTCVVLALDWNIRTIHRTLLPPSVFRDQIAISLHLDQEWNMFSPNPPPSGFWWFGTAVVESVGNHSTNPQQVVGKVVVSRPELYEVIQAGWVTDDGEPELVSGGAVPYDYRFWNRPEDMSISTPTIRWYKIYEGMQGIESVREMWSRFACRKWNSSSKVHTLGRAKLFEMHLLMDHPVNTRSMWRYICPY